jgi:hypothetical protein
METASVGSISFIGKMLAAHSGRKEEYGVLMGTEAVIILESPKVPMLVVLNLLLNFHLPPPFSFCYYNY